MSQNKLKVVMYSDYICPFCYIGFFRIEKLKEQYNLEIEVRPYEIHPEIPKKGVSMDQLPFPREYFEMVVENIMRLAAEDGITMSFPEVLPNSQLALYISEFARKKGKFEGFHEIIFEKYWKEGKNIGELPLLLDVAKSIGLNKDELLAYLNTDESKKLLKKNMLELKEYGIDGVPTFVIGKRIVVGAQSYQIYEIEIKKALQEMK